MMQNRRQFRPRLMRDVRHAMMRDNRQGRALRRYDTASIAQTTGQGNSLAPPANLAQFGWMATAISDMGNTQRWAASLNPDNIIVAANTYPLETLYTTPVSLLNACMIACAGAAGKTYAAATWPAQGTATPVPLTLTANTTTAFGAYVRISNALTTFKFASYEIQFGISGTVYSSILVEVTSLPVEIIILSISNAAGKATVIADNAPVVTFPSNATSGNTGNVNYGSLAVGDVLYAETLNMRDIGQLVGAVQAGQIQL
jgi:hypothetical protein